MELELCVRRAVSESFANCGLGSFYDSRGAAVSGFSRRSGLAREYEIRSTVVANLYANASIRKLCQSRRMLFTVADEALLCGRTKISATTDDFQCLLGHDFQQSHFAKIQTSGRRLRSVRQCDCSITAAVTETYPEVRRGFKDESDYIKGGGSELQFVQMQACKELGQLRIADQLKLIVEGEPTLDLIVIGCGPAGLSLAAEAAKQGLRVGIIGPDLPFTNNYGVWEDEFTALGLENCIEHVWKETVVYLGCDNPIHMGRAYGRVSRHLLREELLRRCAQAGVRYLNSKVEKIIEENDRGSVVSCGNGMLLSCRLVTAASGAASGRFLNYERGGPEVCVQTAYGIEVEVENCPYNPETMVFMDYRDYDVKSEDLDGDGCPPSFLYVMPMSSTEVFFEETCLAARPLLSFDKLKQRLYARLNKMGIKITKILEEEWSYIPVGCAVPDTTQQHLGFGAAASMVHPATGYSVVRSLSEAPSYAAAIASALRSGVNYQALAESEISAKAAASQAWDALWPKERKRQRAFFLFGLELILQLDLVGIRMFFDTFFQLPEWLWKGFLAAQLSSLELIWFAFATFIIAPNDLRYRLVRHLMVDPSGSNLIRTYTSL